MFGQEKTGEEHDKRKQEEDKTRLGQRAQPQSAATASGHRFQGAPNQQIALSINSFINDFFVEIDIPGCPQEKTEEEHDKRRQEEHKARSQNPATERGAANQCGHLFYDRTPAVNPLRNKRRTRPGHRTRPHTPATEFRGSVTVARQLFFSKIDPQQ